MKKLNRNTRFVQTDRLSRGEVLLPSRTDTAQSALPELRNTGLPETVKRYTENYIALLY